MINSERQNQKDNFWTLSLNENSDSEKYPELNIYNIDRVTYLPYKFNQVNDIFTKDNSTVIHSITVGIHWFNGSPISVNFQNGIDKKEIPTTGTIYKYFKKYLDKI